MAHIIHSRPRSFRTRTDAGPFGPVHIAQDFIGGPTPKFAFCGTPFIGGSSDRDFDGSGGVTCIPCGDAIDRIIGDDD